MADQEGTIEETKSLLHPREYLFTKGNLSQFSDIDIVSSLSEQIEFINNILGVLEERKIDVDIESVMTQFGTKLEVKASKRLL